jgi:hypothetical protein
MPAGELARRRPGAARRGERNSMGRHTPFFELQVALEEPGCAICALTLRNLERFFAGLVYEKINDISLRAAIRGAAGFCAAHGAMLREARSALGIAIVQRDVLRASAAALRDGAAGAGQGRGWRAALFGGGDAGLPPPGDLCPACRLADEQVAQWTDLLARHYGELRPAFQRSSGLCRAHLRATLGRGQRGAELREDQLAIWARIEEELDEFIRKHDHQFTGEEVGPERDAWSRATALLAGDWRVTGSRRDP